MFWRSSLQQNQIRHTEGAMCRRGSLQQNQLCYTKGVVSRRGSFEQNPCYTRTVPSERTKYRKQKHIKRHIFSSIIKPWILSFIVSCSFSSILLYWFIYSRSSFRPPSLVYFLPYDCLRNIVRVMVPGDVEMNYKHFSWRKKSWQPYLQTTFSNL